MIVTVEGAQHVYEKMAELPFDSFRKCMTVIVKDAEGVSPVLSLSELKVGLNVLYSRLSSHFNNIHTNTTNLTKILFVHYTALSFAKTLGIETLTSRRTVKKTHND